jgi:CMP-2-keto-3-deoxyoctulosonic acid synthetase
MGIIDTLKRIPTYFPLRPRRIVNYQGFDPVVYQELCQLSDEVRQCESGASLALTIYKHTEKIEKSQDPAVRFLANMLKMAATAIRQSNERGFQ